VIRVLIAEDMHMIRSALVALFLPCACAWRKPTPVASVRNGNFNESQVFTFTLSAVCQRRCHGTGPAGGFLSQCGRRASGVRGAAGRRHSAAAARSQLPRTVAAHGIPFLVSRENVSVPQCDSAQADGTVRGCRLAAALTCHSVTRGDSQAKNCCRI
jgi:hypothetical protein